MHGFPAQLAVLVGRRAAAMCQSHHSLKILDFPLGTEMALPRERSTTSRTGRSILTRGNGRLLGWGVSIRFHAGRPIGAVESRFTKVGVNTLSSLPVACSFRMRASSSFATKRPTSWIEKETVVRGGPSMDAISISSTPTTLRSFGIRSPSSCAALYTPTAT